MGRVRLQYNQGKQIKTQTKVSFAISNNQLDHGNEKI